MWQRIKAFFSDSETIFWARLQALFGFIGSVMAVVDPSLLQPLLTPKGFAIYLLVNGIVTELLRRLRTDDL